MNNIDIDKLPKGHNKYDIIKPLYKKGALNVEFIYKSNYQETKDLRDFVEVICDVVQLPKKMKSRIILISDELNNNAIEYWSSKNWINKLRVKVEKVDKWLFFNIEVEDDWKWKEHKTALDMETMRAHKLKIWYFNHESIRGRWLFLITVKIVDRLYFKNSKNWGLIVGVKSIL